MKSAVFCRFWLKKYEHIIHRPRREATLSSGSLMYEPRNPRVHSLRMPVVGETGTRSHIILVGAGMPKWPPGQTSMHITPDHDHAQYRYLPWDCMAPEVESTYDSPSSFTAPVEMESTKSNESAVRVPERRRQTSEPRIELDVRKRFAKNTSIGSAQSEPLAPPSSSFFTS